MKTSRIKGFYNLSPEKRQDLVLKDLNKNQLNIIRTGGLSLENGDKFIENVVGIYSLPLSFAPNFIINREELLIPMVTEEPSVVAAASKVAKMARETGGFCVKTGDPVISCEILIKTDDHNRVWEIINSKKQEILSDLQKIDPVLVKHGGGPLDIEKGRIFNDKFVLLLHGNSADAMGANSINTMGEQLKADIKGLTGAKPLGSIITNSFPKSLSHCTVTIPTALLGDDKTSGKLTAKKVVEMSLWAENDPQRAVTHNKGIMNGISAVSMAFGNDLRAIESAAHYHAAKDGCYSPLSHWKLSSDEEYIEGSLEMPLPMGIIGGMTSFHPVVKILIEKLKITNSSTLKSMALSAGLANNFAALLAISTTGIQKGHMKLHKRK